MKAYTHFFGAAVSKKTIDVTLVKQVPLAGEIIHKQFSNNEVGSEDLKQWLTELNSHDSNALFCMEATSFYSSPLNHFLAAHSIDIWVEHHSQIKSVPTLSRGKNDEADSMRIVRHAMKNLDRLRLWKPTNVALQEIKFWAAARERLIEAKKILLTPIQEFEAMGDTTTAKGLRKLHKPTLNGFEKAIRKAENSIMEIVNADQTSG